MFINFETQKWILLFIPALKNTKKRRKFCFVFFGFVYLRGVLLFHWFMGLAGFVPYICIQGDVKRGPWEGRLFPFSALLHSMSKPTIKPIATCPPISCMPRVWYSRSPWDKEAGTFFLKYSLNLSRGFLTLKRKAFVDSERLSFSLVNINSPQECFQQDRIFLQAELTPQEVLPELTQ